MINADYHPNANDERFEHLRGLVRDEDGLTEGQRKLLDRALEGIKLDGWVQIVDGIAEETGWSRVEVLMLLGKFSSDYNGELLSFLCSKFRDVEFSNEPPPLPGDEWRE